MLKIWDIKLKNFEKLKHLNSNENARKRPHTRCFKNGLILLIVQYIPQNIPSNYSRRLY